MLCDEILITVMARCRSSLSKTSELTCDCCWFKGERTGLINVRCLLITPPLLVCLYVCGMFVQIFVFHAFGSVYISVQVCYYACSHSNVCFLCVFADTEWENPRDLNEEK